MASVKVASILHQTGSAVAVNVEVRTNVAKIIVPLKFPDRGSAAANEQQAYRELRTFLTEALAVLEAQEDR
jgi:hypothetical protein